MDCSSALAMLPQPSSNIKYTPLKPLFEFHETISQNCGMYESLEMLGHEIPFVQNGFQMVDKWLEII